MQAAFAVCSIENAMWVVRFVQAVAKHLLVATPPSTRKLLVRHLAFEFPLPIFKALVSVVVDVTDASVVNIEDNINSVSEFEEFWHTLGLLDLLHAANELPANERRVGQVFMESARLPKEYFVLRGLDKCSVYSDWKRWKDVTNPALAEPEQPRSNVLTMPSFEVDNHFTCFLSHISFVPQTFLHEAASIDANARGQRQVWRRLEFRRDLEALRYDVIFNLGFCFEKGHKVRLCGLTSDTDCNGKEGELESFDPEQGTWTVLSEDKERKIKPANLDHANADDLRCTLQMLIDPRFAGENGRGPGVMAEFYLLALQSVVSHADVWEYSEEVRTYWFSSSTGPEAKAAFRAVGVILGNAIRLGLLLPAVFPDPLFALLLRGLGASTVGQWSLADLRKVSPHFARSFEHFIEYDQDDAASLFTLDWPRGDEIATLPRDQRGYYVQAYVEWFFSERFKSQADALCKGFAAVVGHSQMLKCLVSVEQLAQIISGVEEPVDLAAIRRTTKLAGWSDTEALYLEDFWSIVTAFSEEQRRKFVVFVSSSARPPFKGWADFGLQLQMNGSGDERMPTAYTCFHLLLLPVYSSQQVLRTRLLQAIEETQGFGLY